MKFPFYICLYPKSAQNISQKCALNRSESVCLSRKVVDYGQIYSNISNLRSIGLVKADISRLELDQPRPQTFFAKFRGMSEFQCRGFNFNRDFKPKFSKLISTSTDLIEFEVNKSSELRTLKNEYHLIRLVEIYRMRSKSVN